MLGVGKVTVGNGNRCCKFEIACEWLFLIAHKGDVWDSRVLKVKSEVFCFNGIEDVPFGMITLQGTITYPTWGKRKIIDSKVPWEKDMLVPGRVQFPIHHPGFLMDKHQLNNFDHIYNIGIF